MKRESMRQRLQRAIAESGLSNAEIARRSGLSEAQLSYFCAGKRSLTLAAVDALADALGLELREKQSRMRKP